MGHEIIAGAGETGQGQIFLQQGDPLLGVHGKFHKTLFRDIRTLQGLFQVGGSFLRLRQGDFQQMAEHCLPIRVAGRITVAAAARQRVFAEGGQDLDHIVDAVDGLNVVDLRGKRRRLFAALKLHRKHHGQRFPIECVGKDHLRHFRADRIEVIFAVNGL